LIRDGEDPESSAYQKKMAAYSGRVEKMNYQRLTPNFPNWPATCFYPMNKWRYPGANWFTLASSERHRLMSEHARSGIKFAGKVTQLITVGVGLDDWEWGVTLWATNPMHLKQIVYDMRFDEASAKYAEFGDFYTSYISSPEKVLEICKVGVGG
jgi:chlorite dismutase